MINVQKIRKLIFDLLNFYKSKEIKSNNKYTYYLLATDNYLSEFDCLSSEKRIGVYSKLSKKDSFICLKLLEILYERNYEFIEKLSFYVKSFTIKLYIKLFEDYYELNKYKLIKSKDIPRPLSNYKRTNQRFYQIDEIIDI